MRRIVPDILIILCIVIAYSAVFFHIFVPVEKLLVTPDYGRSDAWNFSFPTKAFLSQELHAGRFPLWSEDLGNGFPIFAEGQTGVFYLPNLILYSFLPVVRAYNITIILAICMFASGWYVWFRLLGISRMSSLIVSSALGFSGITIPQLPHITLLQGFSLMPWLLVVAVKISKFHVVWVIIGAILVSQQIFAGFPQATFISFIFGILWFLFDFRSPLKSRLIRITLFIIMFSIGACLGAIQLLPSREFLSQTVTPDGFAPRVATHYSYRMKDLLNLIVPDIHGSPKNGSYGGLTDGSIYWENSGFFGILPLISVVFSIFAKKQRARILQGTVILFTAYILMLGKHSPLYFIFSLWPVNLFRTPSRFIFIFLPILGLMSAIGFQYILNKIKNSKMQRIVGLSILLCNSWLLVSVWGNYNLFEPAALWLARPKSVADIPQDNVLFSVSDSKYHNKEFITNGWQYPNAYRFLRTAVVPDANLLWNIPTFTVYAGRMLVNQSSAEAIVIAQKTETDKEATISAKGGKFLDIFRVQTVLSLIPASVPGVIPLSQYEENGHILYRYSNPDAVPIAYIATSISTASTIENMLRIMGSDSFIAGKSAVIPVSLTTDSGKNSTQLDVHRISPLQTEVIVRKNTADSVLILTDTYYPGWIATIDGYPTPIYPANVMHRAIKIPKGDHTVVFTYKPATVQTGAYISIGTAVLLIVVLFVHLFREVDHTVKKAH